ncbi:MAG: tyrosine-type recombinase/integrase [Anaerolineae bacterium]
MTAPPPFGENPTLAEAIEAFLQSVPLATRTRDAYALGLQTFLRFLESDDYVKSIFPGPSPSPPEHLSVNILDSRVLVRFAQWLQRSPDKDDLSAGASEGPPYEPSTVNVRLAALKRFLRFAVAMEWTGSAFDLSVAWEKLRATAPASAYRQRPAIMPDQRIPEIVIYYDRQELPPPDGKPSTRRKRLQILRDRAVVHCIYDTAGRVSEIASLTREQVQDGGIGEVVIRGKGGRERLLFLTPATRRAIQSYCRERGQDGYPALFVSHHRGQGMPLNRVSLWRIVKKAARACGLSPDISPHDFRHYRATQLLNRGARLEDVQAILGHANITTTRQVYAHSAQRTLRDVFHDFTPSPEEALRDWEEEMRRDQA